MEVELTKKFKDGPKSNNLLLVNDIIFDADLMKALPFTSMTMRSITCILIYMCHYNHCRRIPCSCLCVWEREATFVIKAVNIWIYEFLTHLVLEWIKHVKNFDSWFFWNDVNNWNLYSGWFIYVTFFFSNFHSCIRQWRDSVLCYRLHLL